MVMNVRIRKNVVGVKKIAEIECWLNEHGREYTREFDVYIGSKLIFKATKKELDEMGLWDEEYEPTFSI